MSSGDVLELASLPDRHPRPRILGAYGTSTIVRLALSPTSVPPDALHRTVRVERKTAAGETQECERRVGWKDVPAHILDDCEAWAETKNEQDITEEAAVGVMALLIHDLEAAEIRSVLQIGSGGDFLLFIGGPHGMQGESSGILADATGYESTRRIKDKCDQVVKKSDRGLAVVTTFSHKATRDVLCRLYSVSKRS